MTIKHISLEEYSQPLSFIDDIRLTALCKRILEKVERAVHQTDENVNINVIDPFSAAFDAMHQHLTLEKWLDFEKSRQIQKTLQNCIGEFHQAVIGSINGWEDLHVGNSIDLRNRNHHIIAEVKNKFNTMNSSSQLALYDKLQRHLDYDESYRSYTAYCIVIIPKNPEPINVPFHPSERGTSRPVRQQIRMIDGNSFYTLATGEPDALQKLYYHIPYILSTLLHRDHLSFISSPMFRDFFDRAYIHK